MRLNALKHGVTSQQTLLPGEDPAELESFAAALHEELKPQGPLKVLRHETTLEKSLFRAIYELQHLQAKRAGELVPAPNVLDINSH